jgi:hypothetical protein
MGWWRIDGTTGRVAWSSRGADGAILDNHIPGVHSGENHYNGDEVTDILDKAISTMCDRFTITNVNYKAAAKNVFLSNPVADTDIDFVHKKALEDARQKIERVYKREWQRNAYPEELQSLFEFCTAFIGVK